MTISRVHIAPGWATNESLTSVQITQVDLNTTYALDKRTGQTDTLLSGVTVGSGGGFTFANGSSFITASGATFTINSAATFNGTTKLLARKVLLRPRVVLSDADHSIDVSQGDIFQVPATAAAPRTITLIESSPAPSVGETMTIVTNGGLKGTGKRYTIVREDTTTIAEFWAAGNEDVCVTATFDWNGSEWKLGANCGGGSINGGVASG